MKHKNSKKDNNLLFKEIYKKRADVNIFFLATLN